MKNILRAAAALAVLTLWGPARAQEGALEVAPPAQPGSEAKAEPAPEAPAAQTPPADAPVAQPQLVEGAPLGNSNVHVHIVEKKPYTNEGRHELVLYPAVTQLNSKFTGHYGVALMYAYHLFENVALQVTPLFNYWNRQSGFNTELIDKGRQQAQAATALLLQYGGLAGIEVTPMYGKFAFYQGHLGHFTFVLNAGAGGGSTRIQIRPDRKSSCDPATQDCDAAFGSTGFKFLGSVGAGFRVFLGERAAIRLEVRDIIYTARVDKIDGCSYQNLGPGGVSGGSCNLEDFKDSKGKDDIRTAAAALLKDTSSDVVNLVSFYAGFSFLF